MLRSGDLDGDGLDAFLVAAVHQDAAGEDAGAVYVIYGSTVVASLGR